jgi:hypothetical protein
MFVMRRQVAVDGAQTSAGAERAWCSASTLAAMASSSAVVIPAQTFSRAHRA